MEFGITRVNNGWILESNTPSKQKEIHVYESLAACCEHVLTSEQRETQYRARLLKEMKEEADALEAAKIAEANKTITETTNNVGH